MLAQRCEYRIASMLGDRLVVARRGSSDKFFYREYKHRAEPTLTDSLQRLKSLDNPNLVRVFEVTEDSGHTGVYFEHYSMDLASQLERSVSLLDQDSLINTIQPISLAIEYLHSIDRFPSDISAKNIVVNEEGDVKFIDDLLLSSNPQITDRRRSREDDFTRLLQTALQLVDGQRSENQSSIKLHMKKLKTNLGKEIYSFLTQIYDKTKPLVIRIKKIRKRMSFNNENKQRSNPRPKLPDLRVCPKASQSSSEPELIPIKPLN